MDKTQNDQLIEFKTFYDTLMKNSYDTFVQEGNLMNKLLNTLCNKLAIEFDSRYTKKKKSA
jgi:hypothetical protein